MSMTTIPLVTGFVGGPVVALVSEAFVEVVTEIKTVNYFLVNFN